MEKPLVLITELFKLYKNIFVRIIFYQFFLAEISLVAGTKRFTTIGYLCPLGYNIPCKYSNKKFGNPEYVRKHLLNFHKIARKLQKPHFTPIARIAYNKIAGSSPITVKN